MTPTGVAELAKIMRDSGIRRLRLDGVEVELWAPTASAGEEPVPKDFGKVETCKCGHPDEEHHVGGLCLRGCEAKLCANATDTSGKLADEP